MGSKNVGIGSRKTPYQFKKLFNIRKKKAEVGKTLHIARCRPRDRRRGIVHDSGKENASNA